MFIFRNAGPELVETNYWQSEHAQKGLIYVTGNAGTLRMLLPPPVEHYLDEMGAVKHVTIETSLQFPGRCLDFVFDDGTETPFFIAVDKKQIDRDLKTGEACQLVIYTERGRQCEYDATIKTT